MPKDKEDKTDKINKILSLICVDNTKQGNVLNAALITGIKMLSDKIMPSNNDKYIKN